jgi:regulator of protease activity HflC (stomatin/prohibitin superfamily)
MYTLSNLTKFEVESIFTGLMELPAKVANPLLQKLDSQMNVQITAEQQAAQADIQKQIDEANALAKAQKAPRKPKSQVAKAVAETVSTPAQGGEDENSQD